MRVLLWTLIISASTIIFTQFACKWSLAPDNKLRVGFDGFLLATYLGAFLYGITRFRGQKRLRWVLTSTTFLLLAAIYLLDIGRCMDVLPDTLQRLHNKCDLFASSVAGVLLLIAGHTDRTFGGLRLRHLPEYLLVAGGVGAGVKYFAGVEVIRHLGGYSTLNVVVTKLESGRVLSVLDVGVVLFIAAVFIGVVITHLKRFFNTQDYLALLIAYWAVPVGFSIVFSRSLQHSVIHGFWLSTLFSLLAGVVLVCGLNRENGHLFNMAQDKLGELEGLYVVSWELVGRDTMDGLAEALAGALTEHLQASHAAVFLHDMENDGLRLAAVSGENLNTVSDHAYSLATERRSGFHNGHTARAFKNVRTIVVNSIYADVEFIPWEVLAGQDGIIVSVPLVDSEGPVGVYDLFFPAVSSVSQEKIRFFETIGAAAGAAIRHAQMKQGTEPLLRELRAA